MNKHQRTARRIKRQQEEKIKKHIAKNLKYNDLNYIFTTTNMFKSVNMCQKGMFWKDQTKRVLIGVSSNVYDTLKPINDNFEIRKLKRIAERWIVERGKGRFITPITIEDRIAQRCFCDNSLVPLIQQKIIYDNGASQKGKGVDFARKRVKKFLNEEIKAHGKEFYILQFDFKNFFGSIPHRLCYDILKDLYMTDEMARFAMQFITQYQIGLTEIEINRAKKAKNYDIIPELEDKLKHLKEYDGVGVCLGSHISQMLAVIAPNKLDHYIKDICGFKHYVRYMDDGIILHNDKSKLSKLLDKMFELVDELGLQFNIKKTHIVKASKGFTYMQIRYHVDDNNILRMRLSQNSIVRMRRRLKKFYKKYKNGKMSLDDVYASAQSWFEHSKLVPRTKGITNMHKLYNHLFNGYGITQKYRRYIKKHPEDDTYKTRKQLLKEVSIKNTKSPFYGYFYYTAA